MTWIIIFLLIFILAYLGEESRPFSRSAKSTFRVLLVFVLAFISALGSPSGQDHLEYAKLYNTVNIQKIFDFSSFDYYEPGYVLFNGICRVLGIPEASFFLVIGLFINGSIVNFIYKYKYAAINVLLMIIGGAINMQENIVRQEIAAAFFLCSIAYLLNGNIKKYIIILLIASTFHLTALILLILSPLCLVDTEKKGKLIQYIMFGLVSCSILVAVGFVSLPMSDMLVVAGRYDGFMNADDNIGMKFSIYRIIFFNIMAFFMIFFSNKKYYKLVMLLALYAVIVNISVPLPNAARMYPYFDLASITLLLHSLGGGVLKFKIGKMAPVIRFAISCLVVYLIFTQYVFAEKVALLSETYSLIDFF